MSYVIVDGLCVECGAPEAGHKTDIQSSRDEPTLVMRFVATHPARPTHELRQYGAVLTIPANEPVAGVLSKALAFVVGSVIGTSNELDVQPFKQKVATYVVPPGGDHADPIGDYWSVGWKARYLVPAATLDSDLPRLA